MNFFWTFLRIFPDFFKRNFDFLAAKKIEKKAEFFKRKTN